MPFSENLKKWLNHHKMLIKKNDQVKERTHNVMEYGLFLSIKNKYHDTFLKKLSESNVKNFLLEIRTDYFKFMVDIDLKNELGLTSIQKKQLLNITNSAVNQMIDDTIDNQVIISSCKDEEITYLNQNMIKVGFHLIWPYLIVGVDEALKLRSAIIQSLENSNLNIMALEDWETIIDISIYNENHALRMNGSRKKGPCPICKNKKSQKQDCTTCNSAGLLDIGRVYKPFLVLNKDNTENDELLSKLKNNKYLELKLTSIRTDEDETNIKFKQPLPIWFSKNKYNQHLRKKRITKKKKKTLNNDPFQNSNSNSEQIEISENDPIYTQLNKFLISELFKLSIHYKDIRLSTLKKIINKKNYYYVFSSDSKFCLNMNREHSNNHIYFVIDNKGTVYHKCPSPWHNSANQFCKDFRSKSILLNTKTFELLFTDKNKIPNKVKKVIEPELDIFCLDF